MANLKTQRNASILNAFVPTYQRHTQAVKTYLSNRGEGIPGYISADLMTFKMFPRAVIPNGDDETHALIQSHLAGNNVVPNIFNDNISDQYVLAANLDPQSVNYDIDGASLNLEGLQGEQFLSPTDAAQLYHYSKNAKYMAGNYTSDIVLAAHSKARMAYNNAIYQRKLNANATEARHQTGGVLAKGKKTDEAEAGSQTHHASGGTGPDAPEAGSQTHPAGGGAETDDEYFQALSEYISALPEGTNITEQHIEDFQRTHNTPQRVTAPVDHDSDTGSEIFHSPEGRSFATPTNTPFAPPQGTHFGSTPQPSPHPEGRSVIYVGPNGKLNPDLDPSTNAPLNAGRRHYTTLSTQLEAASRAHTRATSPIAQEQSLAAPVAPEERQAAPVPEDTVAREPKILPVTTVKKPIPLSAPADIVTGSVATTPHQFNQDNSFQSKRGDEHSDALSAVRANVKDSTIDPAEAALRNQARIDAQKVAEARRHLQQEQEYVAAQERRKTPQEPPIVNEAAKAKAAEQRALAAEQKQLDEERTRINEERSDALRRISQKDIYYEQHPDEVRERSPDPVVPAYVPKRTAVVKAALQTGVDYFHAAIAKSKEILARNPIAPTEAPEAYATQQALTNSIEARAATPIPPATQTPVELPQVHNTSNIELSPPNPKRRAAIDQDLTPQPRRARIDDDADDDIQAAAALDSTVLPSDPIDNTVLHSRFRSEASLGTNKSPYHSRVTVPETPHIILGQGKGPRISSRDVLPGVPLQPYSNPKALSPVRSPLKAATIQRFSRHTTSPPKPGPTLVTNKSFEVLPAIPSDTKPFSNQSPAKTFVPSPPKTLPAIPIKEDKASAQALKVAPKKRKTEAERLKEEAASFINAGLSLAKPEEQPEGRTLRSGRSSAALTPVPPPTPKPKKSKK